MATGKLHVLTIFKWKCIKNNWAMLWMGCGCAQETQSKGPASLPNHHCNFAPIILAIKDSDPQNVRLSCCQARVNKQIVQRLVVIENVGEGKCTCCGCWGRERTLQWTGLANFLLSVCFRWAYPFTRDPSWPSASAKNLPHECPKLSVLGEIWTPVIVSNAAITTQCRPCTFELSFDQPQWLLGDSDGEVPSGSMHIVGHRSSSLPSAQSCT